MGQWRNGRHIMILYEGGKVYGPYIRKEDNRSHVIIIFGNGIRFTVSYPKYLMELHLQRYLMDNEEVHHKDEDVTNNQLSNFEIINSTEHRQGHQQKHFMEIWICAYCGMPFEVSPEKVRQRKENIKRGKSKTGPFCSKSCSGKINN